MIETYMKNCSHKSCTQINPQPLTEYHNHKRIKGGLSRWCKTCNVLYRRNYVKINPEKAKGCQLRQYWPGLTSLQALAEYNKLFKAQNGLCKICKKPETLKQKSKIKDLSVDHCHTTGKVRSLLCDDCNNVLSRLKENFDTALNIARYIQEHKGII